MYHIHTAKQNHMDSASFEAAYTVIIVT